MKTPCILIALFLGITVDIGRAQIQSEGSYVPDAVDADVAGQQAGLVLIPNLSKASMIGGYVTIPFTLSNNSSEIVKLRFLGGEIDGLAVVDQKTKRITFVENLISPEFHRHGGGPLIDIILKPWESSSIFEIKPAVETLAFVKGRRIFGEISGGIENGDKYSSFTSYSAPFMIPPAFTTLPFNDLGVQNYLSIIPDLTQVYFGGGSFKSTTLELQRADLTYADSIKNGWTERVSFPIVIKNISNQLVAVAIDEVRFYIMGDDREKNRLVRDERWEYLKIAQPLLQPGDSISSEISGQDYITLRFLEGEGYKPGNKIIAVAGGRIPGTNNIFECYSAPFELPPLPKGEPPIPASK